MSIVKNVVINQLITSYNWGASPCMWLYTLLNHGFWWCLILRERNYMGHWAIEHVLLIGCCKE